MENLEVDGWTVRYDRAATAAYYATLGQGDADRCGCSYCRNFALQRATAFPAEFRRLLERLCIHTAKEHEVYEMGPASNGLRCYGGWFCFVGGFTGTGPKSAAAFDDTRFDFGFTGSGGFPWIGDPPRESVSAVGFYVPLPWLLPDENPDERTGDA